MKFTHNLNEEDNTMKDKLKAKWDTMSKGGRVLVCFVLGVILGGFLFRWGYLIGQALYRAIH